MQYNLSQIESLDHATNHWKSVESNEMNWMNRMDWPQSKHILNWKLRFRMPVEMILFLLDDTRTRAYTSTVCYIYILCYCRQNIFVYFYHCKIRFARRIHLNDGTIAWWTEERIYGNGMGDKCPWKAALPHPPNFRLFLSSAIEIHLFRYIFLQFSIKYLNFL